MIVEWNPSRTELIGSVSTPTYAMRGAQEIVSITRSADDVRYPVQQALAQKSIQEAAAKLGIDPAAFRTTLDQIAQDPYSSLDPRQPVGSAIAEVLKVNRYDRHRIDGRVAELFG